MQSNTRISEATNCTIQIAAASALAAGAPNVPKGAQRKIGVGLDLADAAIASA
jgi:hypothetical protein